MADFMEAKYHLAVAERMMAGYGEYPEKRFLIGVINEGARAAAKIILAMTKYENFRDNRKQKIDNRMDYFLGIASRHFDSVTAENIVKILEVEKAQKVSPVEFASGDKLIFLIDGKYRILTISRIGEFLKSIRDGINCFSEYRHV